MSVEGYFSSLSGLLPLYPPCGKEWTENPVLGRFRVGRATFEITICRSL